MAGVELATAYVTLVPSATGMQAAVAKELGGAQTAAAAAGAKSGTGFVGGFSKATAAVTGAVVVGGLLAKVGSDFDKAFDTIRVGTGATGKALDSLKNDFREVARQVPADFGDVGTAIADINTRLGLTGAPLQQLSTQMLELSRITGTDVSTNIEAITRSFGDAGIATEDFSSTLDALFRASQATGPSVQRLAELGVKYGAPMRQFGFSFEQSAALLGKFEKEGVNTELVMGSLRIALGKLSKAGKDPVEGLNESIEAIKNAGSAAEANSLAFQLFGARAGADMAAAIREGRFEIDELFDTVANGEESVLGAAEDTRSLGEQFDVLKNSLLVGLQPAATKVFDALGQTVGALIPVVDLLVPPFVAFLDIVTKIPTPVLALATAFGAVALVGPKILAMGKAVVTAITGISKAFTLLAANPWVLVLLAAVAVGYLIYRNWDTITKAIGAAWDWVADKATLVWGYIRDFIGEVWNAIYAAVSWYVNLYVNVVTTAWTWIQNITSTVWNTITSFFEAFWPILLGIMTGGVGLIVGLVIQNWDAIWAKTQEVWNAVVSFTEGILSTIADFIDRWIVQPIQRVLDLFGSLPGAAAAAWNGVQSAVANVADGIVALIEKIKNAAKDALGPLGDLADKGGSLIGGGIDAIGGALGFDTGGVVPGPTGAPTLALVHGGETILPTHKAGFRRSLDVGTAAIGSSAPSVPAQIVHNDFRGIVVRDDNDLDTIVRAVNRTKRARGSVVGSYDSQGLNW